MRFRHLLFVCLLVGESVGAALFARSAMADNSTTTTTTLAFTCPGMIPPCNGTCPPGTPTCSKIGQFICDCH